MIWVVDKKVVVHLAAHGARLAEIPLRVSFEYALEDGAVVEGSLSITVLYNGESVCRHFPELNKADLDTGVKQTARDAVHEHLALSGVTTVGDDAQAVVIKPH